MLKESVFILILFLTFDLILAKKAPKKSKAVKQVSDSPDVDKYLQQLLKNDTPNKRQKENKNDNQRDLKILDELFHNLMPLGDKDGGLPETLKSALKWCAEFVPRGLAIVGYLRIRYPRKSLLKSMSTAAVLNWGPTMAFYCLNPSRAQRLINKTRIINRYNKELYQIMEESKIRGIYASDKLTTSAEKQIYGCCLWYDAQHKVREILPEESKLFVKEIFKALYEQQTQLFCGQITDGCEECQSLVFEDKPPSRPLYKNWMTHVLELILQFA